MFPGVVMVAAQEVVMVADQEVVMVAAQEAVMVADQKVVMVADQEVGQPEWRKLVDRPFYVLEPGPGGFL